MDSNLEQTYLEQANEMSQEIMALKSQLAGCQYQRANLGRIAEGWTSRALNAENRVSELEAQLAATERAVAADRNTIKVVAQRRRKVVLCAAPSPAVVTIPIGPRPQPNDGFVKPGAHLSLLANRPELRYQVAQMADDGMVPNHYDVALLHELSDEARSAILSYLAEQGGRTVGEWFEAVANS